MKKIILSILLILLLCGAYLIYNMSGFASGVNEDAKIGLYTKWNYNELKNGDIIFQTSKSSQSKAIQIATNSKYSHMGIVYIKDDKYYVFEAVQPVKLTQLKDWILRGVDNHFVVKRLKERSKYFTENNLKKMFSLCEKFKGKSYDIYFNWSDDQMYCSELVWKLYNSIGVNLGKLEKLKDFDLSSELVKKKLKARYGNKIPYEESVISPASIFNSKNLETMVTN